MKYFIISLFIHLLFFGSPYFSKHSIAPRVAQSYKTKKVVTHLSLKMVNEDLKELKKKIVKARKQNLKNKKVQKDKIKQFTKERKELSKLDGERLLQKYTQEIRSFIERRKFYPKKARRMRQSGAVEICLEIDQNGNFHDIHIKNASPHSSLNKAALALVTEISQFKPLPKEMGKSITLDIPLKYALNQK